MTRYVQAICKPVLIIPLFILFCFEPAHSQRYEKDMILYDRDGRFTLGLGDRNLTYAWHGRLATWVTSHFVLRVDSSFASNNPFVNLRSSDQLDAYLLGDLKIKYINGFAQSEIKYTYQDIRIIQRLIPLDKKFSRIDRNSNQKPQYCKIEYELSNTGKRAHQVAFRLLLDTQVNKDDQTFIVDYPRYANFGDWFLFSKPDRDFSLNRRFNNEKIYPPKEKKGRIRPKEDTLRPWPIPKKMFIHTVDDRKSIHQADFKGSLVKGILFPRRQASERYDQLFIGDWGFFQKELWKVIHQNKNYEDGAIIQRWKKRLLPQEKHVLGTYYGLFRPKFFRRLFSGARKVKDTLRVHYQRPTDYIQGTYLRLFPRNIHFFDSTTISWNIVDSPFFSDFFTNVAAIEDLRGSDSFAPNFLGTRIYEMGFVVENSKVAGIFRDTLWVKELKGKDQARFNLGTNQTSFTFGYPNNVSTSHFIVDINGKKATNAPELNGLTELRGKLDTLKHEGSLAYQIVYTFDSVFIKQTLIPLDSLGEVAAWGQPGKYYQIRYEFINMNRGLEEAPLGERKRKIKFAMLLDVNLDNEDETHRVKGKGEYLDFGTIAPVPDTLKIYPADSGASMKSYWIFTSKPDSLYLGLWHQLKTQVELPDTLPPTTFPRDKAVYAQWYLDSLDFQERDVVETLFGSPQADTIQAYLHTLPRSSFTAMYDYDADTLIQGETKALLDFINTVRSTAKAIWVEGYTDSLGEEEKNYGLAKRRMEYIINLLHRSGIPHEIILRKINGEYYSAENPQRQEARNKERSVRIMVF